MTKGNPIVGKCENYKALNHLIKNQNQTESLCEVRGSEASQVNRPVDDIEEEECEGEEGAGIEVNALGGRWNDRFGGRRLLVVFAL